MDILDFQKKCGANPSGTGNELLYARVSDFASIASPTDTPVNPEDLVTIAGTHTFKPGKGFRKLFVTDETGQVMSQAVGEKDGRSFEHTVNGFVPNNNPRNLGLLSMMGSCDWIILVPEMRGTEKAYRQIGSDFRGAYNVDANDYDSGVASADRRGTQFTFKAVGQFAHAPFYDGVITLAPDSGEGEGE